MMGGHVTQLWQFLLMVVVMALISQVSGKGVQTVRISQNVTDDIEEIDVDNTTIITDPHSSITDDMEENYSDNITITTVQPSSIIDYVEENTWDHSNLTTNQQSNTTDDMEETEGKHISITHKQQATTESCTLPYEKVGFQCLYTVYDPLVSLTWQDAQERCQNMSGNLAEVTEVQNTVIDFLKSKGITWAWVARTSENNSDQWLTSQKPVRGRWIEVPVTPSDGCLMLGVLYGGGYKQHSCRNSLYAGIICEKILNGCGGEFKSDRGVIRHPISGGTYQNNENCTWIIRASNPMNITFVNFNTERKLDYLSVWDGESNEVGNFSGDNIPTSFTTITNMAHLHFTSDQSITSNGFELHWRSIACIHGELRLLPLVCHCEQGWTGNQCDIRCGGEFNSSSGTIRHPVNGNYQNNEECIWIIRAPATITIRFVRFSTERKLDFLQLRDGESNGSYLLGNLTGDDLPTSVKTSTTAAHLRFTSDYSITKAGFELHWFSTVCELPWANVENSGCFLVVREKKNWHSARRHCITTGGDLAILDVESQRIKMLNFLRYAGLTNTNIWVGGRFSSFYSSWRWINNRSVKDGWRSGEPNSVHVNSPLCLEIYIYNATAPTSQMWLWDDPCTDKSYFICEK